MTERKALPQHIPVLLRETLELLVTDPAGVYVDATLGGGGHTLGLLQRLNAQGRIIAFDFDRDAIEYAQKTIADQSQITFVHANFAVLESELLGLGRGRVSGVMADLGLSFLQIESQRGFSFRVNAPLDMRFSPAGRARASSAESDGQTLTAADLVNSLSRDELIGIFEGFGEERRARVFTQKIVEFRRRRRIETTFDFLEALGFEPGRRYGPIHPATKVFQALRIATNRELDNLSLFLPQAVKVLRPGGRLVVITFHSLEDRLVKIFFKGSAKAGEIRLLNKKVIRPSRAEVLDNPRARSAKLRAVEKVQDLS